MNSIMNRIGKPLVQGLLALGGFGALTYKFIIGDVSSETYVPLISLMIGFFFHAASQSHVNHKSSGGE